MKLDYLVRGMAREDRIRIIGCECKDTIDLICKKHEAFPIATITLGRFLCATLMMGAMLKDKQTITCILNGNGKLGTIFGQANAKGNIRGFVGDPCVDLPLVDGKWDIETAAGNSGILNVIKNFDEEKNFSSQVAVTSGDIANNIATYFFDSEQMPTIVNLGVELDKDGSVKSARGYIIQLMTGYKEEDVEYLEKLTLATLDKNVETCIGEMFEDFKKLENTPVSFTCDCSKEKFENGLRTLNKDELKQMIEEEESIEVVCNFCSDKYIFTKEELKELL